MTDDHEIVDSIDVATLSLQKGIEKLLKKAAIKKPNRNTETAEKRALRLVRHTRHLLLQLLKKRQSLKALLKCVEQQWKTHLKCKLADPQFTKQILAHTLQLLVRCQDGLMLLTSGECRHPVDIKEARETKFLSRLTTLQERADGYTKLYSGEAYSGYGWDEYANEHVGIYVRLIEILKPFHRNPSDYLENSTQLLETLLDRQEQISKEIQQSLQDLKAQIIQDITKELAKPIVFSTQDKMEKIQIMVPARQGVGEQRISVTRMANNFQIIGSSVLPNHLLTMESWKREISLELEIKSAASGKTSGIKRRRFVLLGDSDSDSENEAKFLKDTAMKNTKKGSVGIDIRVETKVTPKLVEDSLSKIKQKMGVDTTVLESSRQNLDLESKSHHSLSQSYEEEQVQRLEKILIRVQQRNSMEYDPNEVWDAREELRRAYMELGISALEIQNSPRLNQALTSFQNAKDCTIKLQNAHQKEILGGNDTTDHARYITRKLLYLLAEATTNIGVTFLEMANQKPTASKKLLSRSIRELRCTKKIIVQLKRDIIFEMDRYSTHSESWIGLMEDKIEADMIDSLVCRYLGEAAWRLASENYVSKAEKWFKEAWSVFRGFDMTHKDRLLLNLLGLFEVCLENCSIVVNLGMQSFDEGKIGSQSNSRQVLSLMETALKREIQAIEELEEFRKSTENESTKEALHAFKHRHSEINADTVQQRLEVIRSLDTELIKTPEMSKIKKMQSMKKAAIPRSELSGFSRQEFPQSSGYYVVGSSARFKEMEKTHAVSKARRHYSTNLSTSATGSEFGRSFHKEAKAHRPVKFRRWGDQLLDEPARHVQDDNLSMQCQPVMESEHPSMVPKMPPHLKSLFNKQSLKCYTASAGMLKPSIA